MAITVRGTAPKPPVTTWDHQTLHLDENTAWTDLTAAMNLLYYDGERLLAMRQALQRLDRICASRSAKLDIPVLRDHPGYDSARDELIRWRGQAINLNAEITGLTIDLRKQARRVDESWRVLRPEIRDAIAESQRWIGQVSLAVIPALGDVKELAAWAFLLTRWRELFAEVPF